MAEIANERAAGVLEAVRGTAINPPTRALNVMLSATPQVERYTPDESTGYLAARSRSKTIRRSIEWEGEGGADTREMHWWAAMYLRGAPVMTTPSGATNARLWTAARSMVVDDIKSATLYTGDPNTQEFQISYAMGQELTLSADASGTDGVQLTVNGVGRFWEKVAPSSYPTRVVGPLLAPGEMQVWMDTSSAIGTTELVGRVVSADLTVNTGVTTKYLAAGPGAGLTFTRTGREKTSPESTVVFEFLDLAQYDLFHNNNGDTIVKLRVRLNGPIIETTLRHFIEWDIWGPLDAFEWGELEGTNRTMGFTITGEYDATAATDLILRVQNDQTSL